MSILSEILAHKRREVRASMKRLPSSYVKNAALALPRKKNSLEKALRASKKLAIIAEIKHRSPSKGLLRKNFDPARIAKQYDRSGASALSVLTDKKYFGGLPEFLVRVKRVSDLPVLRKDFILEEYQVYESRLLGADAILLIASALPVSKLRSFYKTAKGLGLDVLFEVHSAAELKKVLPLRPNLIGINNRDLRTFKVDLMLTRELSKAVPRRVLLVSESGIGNADDLRTVRAFGARAVLVGEAFMRAKDPGKALKRLLGGFHGTR